MEPYHYWLIASAFLILLELVTAGFGVICFAIGTLVATLLAYIGLGLEYQITAFIVGSILALIFVRPFAKTKYQGTIENLRRLLCIATVLD